MKQKKECTTQQHAYLYDKVYILWKWLHTIETRQEHDSNPSIFVHVTTQEEILLQILIREVILSV